ncbi:MAG: hypothetical protein GY703_13405 [Gammaproteobacteria bacterium]|nr:hypothetical protein [Gammaproteobacteria bacterium]
MKNKKTIAELSYHLDMVTQGKCDQRQQLKWFLTQCREAENKLIKKIKQEEKKPKRRRLKKELDRVQDWVSQLQKHTDSRISARNL